MAKLALFFFGLLLIQYTVAGVVKREAPASTTTNNAQQSLEDALKNLQNMIQNAFSKEQIEAFGKQVQAIGDTLGEKGQEFLNTANENLSKLKTTH